MAVHFLIGTIIVLGFLSTLLGLVVAIALCRAAASGDKQLAEDREVARLEDLWNLDWTDAR